MAETVGLLPSKKQLDRFSLLPCLSPFFHYFFSFLLQTVARIHRQFKGSVFSYIMEYYRQSNTCGMPPDGLAQSGQAVGRIRRSLEASPHNEVKNDNPWEDQEG